MSETNTEPIHKYDLVAAKIVDLISQNPDYSLSDIRGIVGDTYTRRLAKGDRFNYIVKRILEEIVLPKLNREQRTHLREREIAYERELTYKSRVDELTGLYRRGYFLERVNEEIGNSPRMRILMVDLDFLKDCNDTYGHSAGDEALRQFGRLMREHFTDHAIFGRWGGEEFALAIPENLADFNDRLKDFRGNFQASCKAKFTDQTCRFQGTMSIGLYHADFSQKKASLEDAINFADDALYHAKTNRNCLVVWNQNLPANPKRK